MTDWLTYEWELEGREATFRVDLQYWSLLPVLAYSQLIYVSCAPKNPEATAFSKSEEHMIAGLRHMVNTQLEGHSVYVGSIRFDALEQLYFYTADETLVNHISGICRTFNKLATVCGHISEPHYATYYRLLFPDDAKLQSVENAALIQNMQKRGGDLTLVRRIELEMAFLNRDDCMDFAGKIVKLGFTPDVMTILSGGSHPCRLTIYGYCTLLLPELNRFTARAINLAAKYDGLLEKLNAPFIRA
ncbi:MAG: DUF695 domain-containing protein [Clostridia bacterium]|nr:DUF695 domain-containing protein [Clostridia bacterium]